MGRLFSNQTEREIVRQYREGRSTLAIGRDYDTSPNTISGILERRGCDRRTTSESAARYNVNREAFLPPLSSSAEYWAGFLMADGCVTDQGALRLCLQQRDRPHVEKFRAFMESEHPIFSVKQAKAVGILIGSKDLCQALVKLGVTPRKSLVSRAHDSVADSRHFWRGMIDGDGHIRLQSLSLTGGQDLLNQWLGFETRCGCKPQVIRRVKRELFRSECYGSTRVKMLDILYRDTSPEHRLDRKFEAASDALRTAELERKQISLFDTENV